MKKLFYAFLCAIAFFLSLPVAQLHSQDRNEPSESSETEERFSLIRETPITIDLEREMELAEDDKKKPGDQQEQVPRGFIVQSPHACSPLSVVSRERRRGTRETP